jgi:hypothetical protein
LKTRNVAVRLAPIPQFVQLIEPDKLVLFLKLSYKEAEPEKVRVVICDF